MNLYISVSNNDDAYINNTNSSFTMNIKQLMIKKYCKVAITDISYTNEIKKNMGSLEISIKNTTKEEDADYLLFLNNLRKNIIKINEKLEQKFLILKDHDVFSKNLIDEKISPEYEEMKKYFIELKNQFIKLVQFMDTNKLKTFPYYISDILKYWQSSKYFLQKLPLFTYSVRDHNFESEIEEEINKNIFKINRTISFNRKVISFQFDLEVYNNWKIDDILNYFLSLTSIFSDYYNVKKNLNKIIFEFSCQFKFKFQKQIQDYFNCTFTSNSVEFHIPKEISLCKNMYIYTDITEDYQISELKDPNLDIIKLEGEFNE